MSIVLNPAECRRVVQFALANGLAKPGPGPMTEAQVNHFVIKMHKQAKPGKVVTVSYLRKDKD